MSGFMKKASIMAIAGSQALLALENPGGLPSRRVVTESPGSWLPAGTKPRPKGLNLGGGVGHRGRLFGLETGHFLCRPCCAGFKGPAASQPHTSKLGE